MSDKKPASPIKPLILCIVCLIAIQTGARFLPNSDQNYKPGDEKEDWDPPGDALPEQMKDWTFSGFTPGASPAELPENQNWWTHEWRYRNEEQQLSARVSLDQSTFHGWHELTQCYEGIGWTLEDRQVIQRKGPDSWPLVVAKIRNQQGDFGLLIFSLFFEDGTFVFPIDYDLIDKPDSTLAGRFMNRDRNSRRKTNSSSLEALQCQTLAVASRAFSNEDIDSVIDLHTLSRKSLLAGWLDSRSQPNGTN